MEDVLKFIENKFKQGYDIDITRAEDIKTELKYIGNTVCIQVPKSIYNEAIMKLAQLKQEERAVEKAYNSETYKVFKLLENKGGISRKIENANQKEMDTRYTINDIKQERNNRKTIKNKPKKITKKRFGVKTKEKLKNLKDIVKKIGAKLLLALLLAGVALSVIIAHVNDTPQIEKEPTTNQTEEYEGDIDNEISIDNEIDTIKEVEEDFVERYLEAYNEKYGTDYKTGDMIVTALRDGAVYELSDGRKVTRGSKPYETEKVLNNIGEFDIANINSEVLQIVSNGRTLGTYNMLTGEFIYSGNQLSDLTNEEFEEPTLESLGINKDKLTKAGQALRSQGVEGKDSEKIRVENYANEDFER